MPNPIFRWWGNLSTKEKLLYGVGGAGMTALLFRGARVASQGGSIMPTSSTPTTSLPSPAGTYDRMIAELGIDPRMARAFIAVESSGNPYVDGRLIIRFEPHIFRFASARFKLSLSREATRAEALAHGDKILLPGMNDATSAEGLRRFSDRRRSLTEQQAEEYGALERAKLITEEGAYRSISMGVGQIMGFNHHAAGYTSAKAMFYAMQNGGLEEQKVGMLRFIRSNSRLLAAVRAKDFSQIARRYNGDSTGRYAGLLQTAYNRA